MTPVSGIVKTGRALPYSNRKMLVSKRPRLVGGRISTSNLAMDLPSNGFFRSAGSPLSCVSLSLTCSVSFVSALIILHGVERPVSRTSIVRLTICPPCTDWIFSSAGNAKILPSTRARNSILAKARSGSFVSNSTLPRKAWVAPPGIVKRAKLFSSSPGKTVAVSSLLDSS